MDIYDVVIPLLFAFCGFYYAGAHWSLINKGFEITRRYREKTKVSFKDYISFILLILIIYDFYH